MTITVQLKDVHYLNLAQEVLPERKVLSDVLQPEEDSRLMILNYLSIYFC